MEEYDQWASVYDAIYGEHTPDISFYDKEAKKAHGPVLELACGTGRILLPMLKAGIEAHGVDISGKMLGVLKRKASSLDLKPSVYLADMRTFKLKKKFSLIIVPFRAFLHNLTIEDQLSSLKCLRRHLAPGGVLLFDFWHAAAVLADPPVARERRIQGDGFTLVRRTVPEHLPESRAVDVHFSYTADGSAAGTARLTDFPFATPTPPAPDEGPSSSRGESSPTH